MKNEFITVNGKVVVDRDAVLIIPVNRKLITASRSFIPFLLIVVFINSIFNTQDNRKDYVNAIFWGLVVVTQLPALYDMLIRRNYANRIPIEKIDSFEIKADNTGLETFVLLKLKSGRYREICFRTMEAQLEPFTEVILERIGQTKLQSIN